MKRLDICTKQAGQGVQARTVQGPQQGWVWMEGEQERWEPVSASQQAWPWALPWGAAGTRP